MEGIGTLHEIASSEFEIEWKIPNYFLVGMTLFKKCFKSPTFSFAGTSWYIIMLNDDQAQMLSSTNLYLIKKLSSTPISLKFSLGIKNLLGEKETETHCNHLFTKEEEDFKVVNCFSNFESFFRRQWLITNPEEESTIFCNMELPKLVKDAIKISTSESPVLPKEKKILQDLKNLFLNKEDCDATIRVKDQEFRVHRIILKARSTVFASAFRNDMKEKATGIIDIQDCDPSSFSDFLCFLYCEDLVNLKVENVFSLFTAADKYDVPDLKGKCLEFMKENLSIETFCDTMTVALQYSETELVNLTTDFFIKNAEKIILTTKWQVFVAENPTQSNELFIKHLAAK